MAQGVKANISKESLEELLKEHTYIEIAEKLNVSVTTIKRYCKKYELKPNYEIAKIRNSQKHTKYPCDVNYFNKIDTMNKAYLLGFICADGFVTDRNEIGIGISEKDKDIIEFFKKELKSEKPISKKISQQGHSSVEIRIQNNYLAQTIQTYGIVPNKSLILDISKVIEKAKLNDKQISAFLLGYFDGDGCISIAHRKDTGKEYFEMNVTGTKETILYFKQYFGHGTITKRHKNNKNNYTLQFSNNFSTIYNALSKLYQYKNELNFYFERKYNLFVKLKNKVKS